MTIGDWLAAREPRPPVELTERLLAALGAGVDDDVSQTAPRFLAVALSMTEAMLASGSTSRDTALDLLTIDALVTYAYEAAAEEPDAGRALAIEGMTRLSWAGSRDRGPSS